MRAAQGLDRQVFQHLEVPALVVDASKYGDGSKDATAHLQALITAALAASNDNRSIFIPAGVYVVSAPLLVGSRGLRIAGASRSRGTTIKFTGTGALFQLGADSGRPHDSNEYDGTGSHFTLEDITLETSGGATALSNGQGNYLAGSYGIRDWRGGEVSLRRVTFEGFEFGFWGVQSDLNTFAEVLFIKNKVGAYLGPRSDQFTGVAVYTALNDLAFDLDRASGARFIGCSFVGDGHATGNAIKVRSAWSAPSEQVVFEACWFEHYQGAAAVDAFVEVGVGDSVTSEGVHFISPLIATQASGGTFLAKHLCKVGNGTNITVTNPGANWDLLDQLLWFVGTTSPKVMLMGADTSDPAFGFLNTGSGSPAVSTIEYGGTGGRSIFNALEVAPVGDVDGATLLHLGIARPWAFRQSGTGSGVMLDLHAVNSDKEFKVTSPNGTAPLRINQSDTAANNLVYVGNTGGKVGFFGITPRARPTGVAVSAAGIHAALVSLGLIAA